MSPGCCVTPAAGNCGSNSPISVSTPFRRGKVPKSCVLPSEVPTYRRVFTKSSTTVPQSHPLSIYTDGGSVPARIWTLEERDKPGKQFYDRGAWTFDRTDEERAEWTFTVTADDLE